MDYHCRREPAPAGVEQFRALARTVRIATRYNPGVLWGNYMLEVARMLTSSGNEWLLPEDVRDVARNPVLWACYHTGHVDEIPNIGGW